MDTTKAGSIASGNTQGDYKTWRKSDTVWMLGLYGTAIGAGVLFLPINDRLCTPWYVSLCAIR